MDALSKKLLALAVDPNATMDELLVGMDLLTRRLEAENRQFARAQAAKQRATVHAASSDPAALRRLANANLSKRYR